MDIERPAGGVGKKFLFRWFIRHLLVDLEKRNQEAIKTAQRLGKPIITVYSYKEADQLIHKIKSSSGS